MAINFASTANFQIQSTEALTIDASGRFLTPSQPSFNIMSGDATASGSNVRPASTQQFNIGSFYNTANGRFTAQIAGVYFVRFQQLINFASTGEFRTALYRNDAPYSGYRFITHKAGGGWRSLIAEGLVQMSVNDYVTVRYETGPAALYTDSNYATFSGHLIG